MLITKLQDLYTGLQSSSPGLSPSWAIVFSFWARHFTITIPLSTRVHKWVPANLMTKVTLQWTSVPSRGVVLEILLVTSRWKAEICTGLKRH